VERADIDRLKASVSIVAVARELGLEVVERAGRRWARCPLHGSDSEPSLEINEQKGLYNCFGCPGGDSGGDVLRLVERVRGVSFSEAVAFVARFAPGAVVNGNGRNGRHGSASGSSGGAAIELAEGLGADASPEERRARILTRASDYWVKTLSRSRAGLGYLSKRGLHDGALIARFGIGYSDGSLARKAPAAMKGELVELGLVNERGNESLFSCITFPLRGSGGEVLSVYGRSTGNRHHYLRGPRRGLVNGDAFARGRTVIVAESIIDAMSLVKHGFEAVPIYGTQGFTDDHRAAIAAGRTELVVLCLNADEAGRAAVEVVGSEIERLNKEVLVVDLPCKDVNEYFVCHGGTAEGFRALLESARPLADGRRTTVAVGSNGNGAAAASGGATSRASSSLPSRSSSPSSPPSSPLPPATLIATATPVRPPELVHEDEREIVLRVGELDYRVSGRVHGGGRDLGSLRLALRVVSGEAKHIDRLDLYVAAARRRFAREAGEVLGREPKAIEAHLVRVAELVEWVKGEQERRMKEKVAGGEGPERPPMTDEERRAAITLLEDPRLLERVVSDLDALGYVGEAENKRLCYLVATSRLLARPLGLVFRSGSAAGKSRLMELVAELMPPEEVSVFSRITPQALYYMRDGIAHKLLVVDEREGSDAADYSIRSLQSRGKLSAAVPQKDPVTGAIVTQTIEIEGPVAYMESTTRERLNLENENRVFAVSLDESPEQTERIFAAARAQAAKRGLGKDERAALVTLWRNAQRLIERVVVEIPFAEHIRFPVRWVRCRRDHERFLGLIAASALLHQRQRVRRPGAEAGAAVPAPAPAPAVLAAVSDYAVGFELAKDAIRLAQSDASGAALELLGVIFERTAELARGEGLERHEVSFTCAELCKWSGRPRQTAWRQVRELVRLEYVLVVAGGKGRLMRYRLNDEVAALPPENEERLLTPEELAARIAEAERHDGSGDAG